MSKSSTPDTNTYESADWEAYGKAVHDWADRTFGCTTFSIPATREEWLNRSRNDQNCFYLRSTGDQKPPIPLVLDNSPNGHTAEELGGLVWLTMKNPIPWEAGWMGGMARDGKRKRFLENINTQLFFEEPTPGDFLFEDQVWNRYEAHRLSRTSV